MTRKRDAEDLAELLDPSLRGDTMFSVRDGACELVGFFAFQNSDGVVDFRSGTSSGFDREGTGGEFRSCGPGFRAIPILTRNHPASRCGFQ